MIDIFQHAFEAVGGCFVRGVYFSSNDVVFDWTIAFLESFRRHNPDMHLRWIPFGANVRRTERLVERFGAYPHECENYDELERMGKQLDEQASPTSCYWFRRYASFWGPLEEFLYLDCRILVLSNLEDFVTAPLRFGFDLVHYDRAVDQVYNLGNVRLAFLREGLAHGFLSGMWASRQGMFTLDQFVKYAEECLAVRGELNARNTDQFFINYCCDRNKLVAAHFAELVGDTCQDGWARQAGYVYRAADAYRRWDFGGLNHKKKVPLLHWGGVRLSAAMPEAELFYLFRDAEYGLSKRFIRKFWRMVLRPFVRLVQALRANRKINESYHRIVGK